MSAALTDNFTEVSVAGTQTTLAAPGKAFGASSLNLTNPSGWQTLTGQIFAMRRVDSSGNYVPGSYTEWIGVLAGAAMTINPTPLYGTDPAGGYAADGLTQVFVPLSSTAWNRMMSAILNQHTQAGAHVGLTNTGGANFTGGITTDSLTITGSQVGAGWSALGSSLTYAANNGEKDFTCTAPANLTTTLSPGMHLQVTRNTVPPTQCFSLAAASTQYATKASPTGIAFTAAFTIEAWVYLNSYAGGTNAGVILNRFDGSANGWGAQIHGDGSVQGFYASGGNTTSFGIWRNVPLKKWTHVAIVVSSVSSKTFAVYINGTSCATTTYATAATALAQPANDLRIGAYSASPAGSYFDGLMSEVRLWSVAQTQSQIQANMGINLIGTESNLVGLWQGNGNWNDATSNANSMTANGGAIATQANNPYNAVEYFTVIGDSYSNPNTTVELDGGTMNTLPNMTLNSPQYSTAANPYGLPVNLKKYSRYIPLCQQQSTTTANPSSAAVLGMTVTLTIPVGKPNVKLRAFASALYNTSAGSRAELSIWDGTVGSGVQVAMGWAQNSNSSSAGQAIAETVVNPDAGSKTYNVGFDVNSTGTAIIGPGTGAPAFLLVEVDL